MKILVTGGSGWVGSHLVKNLENEGHKVYNYDLKNGFDITNEVVLNDIFGMGFDRVYHLAAQAFMGIGEKHPHRDVDINIKGMINLLQCIEKYKVPLVYTSSGAVYGITKSLPHSEDATCIPVSNYGVSKLAAEYYLKKWVATKEIDAKIIRFSSVYGKGRTHGPVNIFINRALANKPLTVFGTGKQTRDLTYIDDAIQGVKLVMEKGCTGETYNIGVGYETSVETVANIVGKHFDAEVTYVPNELGAFDLPRSWYDISKISKLGYEADYDPVRGIVKTIKEETEK